MTDSWTEQQPADLDRAHELMIAAVRGDGTWHRAVVSGWCALTTPTGPTLVEDIRAGAYPA